MAIAVVSEQAILEKLQLIPRARWGEVLEFLDRLHPPSGVGAVEVETLAAITWTAAGLRTWPRPLQDAILRAQAARLVAQFHEDPDGQRGVIWWTAREMAQLPVEQRDILLEASAIIAAQEYHTNAELTAFDAFGEEDLYVDSATAESIVRKPPTTDTR